MLYLGADHGGFELKESIKKYLDEKGIEYEDCGTYSADSVDYALIAKKTCDKIVAGEGNKGILVCLGCETDFVSRNSDFHGGKQGKRYQSRLLLGLFQRKIYKTSQ